MRLLHIFGYGILYFTNLCVQENDVVVVGKLDLQCGDHGNIIKAPSNVTKIKLPKRVESLYSVTSEKGTSCMDNSTKCRLMTWNIIRSLEILLNKHFNNTGPTGIIQFRNNMIIPGYNYLLHVIMKTSSGSFVEKSFNLTFDANHFSEDEIAFLGNLELITGTYVISSTFPIVVNANLTLCGHIPYYYFRWFLSTDDQELELNVKSSELIIYPGSIVIEKNKVCKILCKVLDFENHSVISETSIDLLLTAPQEIQLPDIFLPFKYTTFNKGAPISIAPYISFPKPMEDYQTQWSCLLEDTLLYVCQGQTNEEFYLETGFNQEGNYTITILVSSGNIEVIATCHVIVEVDVPSIEFVIPYPIQPEQGIEITARVSELRTFCTVQWIGYGDNDLKTISGTNIYNISSKDQTFLEEMVELGSITVSRDFKLKFSQSPRTWPGLESKHYQVTLTVVCPSLHEVSNENIVEEQPANFVTVHGETGFFVPPSPNVEVLVIGSDQNEALKSEFTFVVELAKENSEGLMLVKYGIVLEGVEIQFYTGINALTCKTILPYNGDFGVETYIEICDHKNRCSRTLGPLVKSTLSYNYSEKEIYHKFMQKLIEEDYYKVFSYVFMVQHSLGFDNRSNKFSSLFSSQLIRKVEDLDTESLNGFLRSAVIFMDHIKLTNELWKKLFSMIHEFRSSVKSIHPSRFVRSPDISLYGTGEKLDAIENLIKISELLMLNLEQNGDTAKEKIHFLNMIDQWMIEACIMLFDGHHGLREFKFDSKIAHFVIEKILWQTLRDSIKMPFDNYIWNLTTYLNYLSIDDDLCFGFSKLDDILLNDTSFGIKIYSSRIGDFNLSDHGKVEVYMPYLGTAVSQCNVYNRGSNIVCEVSKSFSVYVQCVCPKFGYFYLSSQTNILESINHTLKHLSNESCGDCEVTLKKQRKLGHQISYVIILSSVIGVGILCYILRQLTVALQHNVENEGFTDYE